MNIKLIAEFISKDHPTAINLLDVKGSFANWVKENTDWIKSNANIKDKRPLLDRLDHLRDEGVKISPEKVAQLKDRLLKARNNFDMYSVFYLAAVSYDKLDPNIKTKRAVHEEVEHYLSEDYYIPASGKHFSHFELENELEPGSINQLVKTLAGGILGDLNNAAKELGADPEQLIAYVMPEVVKELNMFGARKTIGF